MVWLLLAPQIKVAQGCDITQKCLVTKRHVMSYIKTSYQEHALPNWAMAERWNMSEKAASRKNEAAATRKLSDRWASCDIWHQAPVLARNSVSKVMQSLISSSIQD